MKNWRLEIIGSNLQFCGKYDSYLIFVCGFLRFDNHINNKARKIY